MGQGDYVVLAAEPVCIVGVDVAAPQQIRAARPARDAFKRASSMEDLQQTFQRQFTAHEARHSAPSYSVTLHSKTEPSVLH